MAYTQIPAYLNTELQNISNSQNLQLSPLTLNKLKVAPAHPVDGQIAYAGAAVLGTNAGIYVYKGSTWVFIG